MATLTHPHPKVFISYSHDSREHADRVLELSNHLLRDGIDCVLDQYETAPSEGWPRWMERRVRDAAFVLVVCTEIYNRRVLAEEEHGKGLGVLWESNIIYNYLYQAGTVENRFIPVVFEPSDVVNIPMPLQGVTRYDVHTDTGYEDLYRRLTDQPRVLKPQLGKLRELPTRERKTVPDDEDVSAPATTPALAAAALKRYLDEGQRVRAHDLMFEETRYLRENISDEHFPLNSVRVTPEAIRERVAQYESLSATVQALMVAGCYWGRPEHDGLWRQCVEMLAEEPSRFGGSLTWMHLSSYPALLTLYAGGLAAIATGNYDNLVTLLVRGSTWRDQVEMPLVVALSRGRVFLADAADYLSTDAKTKLYAPVSEHLHAVLRAPLKEYAPQDAQYDKCFDRFEFLLALVYGDVTSKRGFSSWLPIGRFGWRVKHAPLHGFYDVVKGVRDEAQAAGEQWSPLKAGLFDGSMARFNSVFSAYMSYLQQATARWM